MTTLLNEAILLHTNKRNKTVRKLSLLGLLALAGCASVQQYPGADLADNINSDVNTLWDYHYADQPKGHKGQVMSKGDSGNCYDFAVTKCALLSHAGISSDRLSIWAYNRPDGVGHAVCVIDQKYPMDWAPRGGLTVITRDGKLGIYEGQIAKRIK